MLNRTTIFKNYLDLATIDAWFNDHVLPQPAMLNRVARAAAEDFISHAISYDEFSLVCMNLHFEAALRYSGSERERIEPEVDRVIRLFADPGKNEIDSSRYIRKDLQEQVLAPFVKRRAA